MATSVVFPRVQFFANNGKPLIGGRIHTYVAGTSKRAPTYKDAAKTQANTNPIQLDARGEAPVYLAEGVEYKFVIEDALGSLIMTQEPIYGAVWPNAGEWPSDATLSYQYMLDAKAAADSVAPRKVYDTYAQALGDISNLANGDLVEVSRDETRDGSRTRYRVAGSALVFVVNLDQLRMDVTQPTGQDPAGGLDSFARLRLFRGQASKLPINSNGVAGQFFRDDADAASTDDGGVCIIDALGRRWKREYSDDVNVKWFGAKGDYTTDDTAAILAAFAFCAKTKQTLFFPSGAYRVTQSLKKQPGFKIRGTGKPNFNLTVGNDDKRFLRPGFKHLMPGSSIFWSGSQTDFVIMPRTDRWQSFGYMLQTQVLEPDQIENMGLICDCDVYDAAGELTNPYQDNRANYDTGLVVAGSVDSKFRNIGIYGYFGKKKGVVVTALHLGLSNPDYNYFFDCTIFAGVALLGYRDSPNQGLSATNFIGCTIYDQTYHNRSATLATDHTDQSVVLIDGKVSTGTAIAGHKFIGGGLRSTCPNPIQLDFCHDVSFLGVTTEFVLNAGYPGQTLKHISGTTNTERVVFAGSRTSGSTWGVRLRAFQAEIKGPLVVDENSTGCAYLYKNSMGIAYGPSDELAGDPVLQMSREGGTSVTKGWNLRHISTNDFSFRFDGATKAYLTTDGVMGVLGGIGKSGASTPAAPALLPYSGDIASGFYRAPSLIGVSIDGGPVSIWNSYSFRPGEDNTMSLGLSGTRWSVVYAGTGTINTSDEREKTAPEPISEALLDAWGDVQLVAFKWLESVASKGNLARVHTGVIAQRVRDALIAHGVMQAGSTHSPWAGLCYDAWSDQFEDVMADIPVTESIEIEEGVFQEIVVGHEQEPTREKTLVRAAGDLWGIRADQCLFLEAAYQRREMARFKQRLSVLEGA